MNERRLAFLGKIRNADQHGVSRLLRRLLNGLGRRTIDGIGHHRDDEAKKAGSARGQPARQSVRDVMMALNHRQHRLAGRFLDLVRLIEGRDTVAVETPASRAISLIVIVFGGRRRGALRDIILT